VVQCGRQLTDPDGGRLRGKRFLLDDRDPRFTDAFAKTMAATGVETVRLLFPVAKSQRVRGTLREDD
jgi:hypothetical protein